MALTVGRQGIKRKLKIVDSEEEGVKRVEVE
jgi:hypothetical protein